MTNLGIATNQDEINIDLDRFKGDADLLRVAQVIDDEIVRERGFARGSAVTTDAGPAGSSGIGDRTGSSLGQ